MIVCQRFMTLKWNSLTIKFNATAGFPITDSEGLDRACDQGDACLRGDALYIAGSHAAQIGTMIFQKLQHGVILKILKRTRKLQRLFVSNPNTKNATGHSLGGAVALELQKQNPVFASKTHSASGWNFNWKWTKRQHGVNIGLTLWACLAGQPRKRLKPILSFLGISHTHLILLLTRVHLVGLLSLMLATSK